MFARPQTRPAHGLRPPVAPTGLTLVMGLNPASTLLAQRREDILASYLALGAGQVVARPEFAARPLGVNAYDWVRRWLDEAIKNAAGQ